MTRLRSTPMLPWIVALVAVAAAAVVWVARDDDGGRDDDRPAPARAETASVPDVQTPLSRPDLRPPSVAVDVTPARPGDAVMFLSPRLENPKRDGATHQQGALGIDDWGRTRWFRPAPDGEPVTDVRVQRYEGKPVLTWWQGAASKYGIGRGEGVIVDDSYRPVATVQAGNDLTIDLHEFLLTARGTALVTIYTRARRDLRAMGGRRDAQVTEGVVQEIDVKSGRVLFEWHSLDHVDPSESFRKPPAEPGASFDYFHINSVAEDADGDLLVSARHTSAIYKIDRRSGDVVWRLGGKKSDFAMGPDTEFGLQHDARYVGEDLVQLFDNAAEAGGKGAQAPSSVRTLRLDRRRMRASLRAHHEQPDGLWAESQGNAQPLPGGGVMVGWGSTGAISRFDADGGLAFDAQLPAQFDTYRAYRFGWRGRPLTPPAIHAAREKEQVTVRASWNGATEVHAWRVLAGRDPQGLRPIGAATRWTGFETRIVRATGARYVAVEALDAAGRPLERSAAVRPRGELKQR